MDELTTTAPDEAEVRRPWEKPRVEWEDPLEVRLGLQLVCVKSPDNPICLSGQITS